MFFIGGVLGCSGGIVRFRGILACSGGIVVCFREIFAFLVEDDLFVGGIVFMRDFLCN